MRLWHMRFRDCAFVVLPLLAFASAACERKPPEPRPVETPAAPPFTPPPAVPATPTPTPEPPAASPAPPALDMGALNERRNPERLLRFYADALRAGDWGAAARAWGAQSGVTAATLKAAYDRPERPRLEIGKATTEGAAGSLYYEAPVSLRFGDGPPERGTLTLRRVNDVPGATAEQLRWHIERATIGLGQ